MRCEDCGNDKGVQTICPYEQDINGEIVEVILCPDCEENRADDI